MIVTAKDVASVATAILLLASLCAAVSTIAFDSHRARHLAVHPRLCAEGSCTVVVTPTLVALGESKFTVGYDRYTACGSVRAPCTTKEDYDAVTTSLSGSQRDALTWSVLLAVAALVAALASRFATNRILYADGKRSVVLLQSSSEPIECCVCLSRAETHVALRCGHKFHQSCVVEWIEKTPTCPSCRHAV